MSGYEEEHNITRQEPSSSRAQPRPRRGPEFFSTFFSSLDRVDTSGTPGHRQHNPHADPLPVDVSAAFRNLAEALSILRTPDAANGDLLNRLVLEMTELAEHPPKRVKGMSDEWFDRLDRVDKAKLKPDDACGICANEFLSDPYPLVVRLPCHHAHKFDLLCIRSWLKLNTTCPFDRTDFLKKEPPAKKKPDDDEEEWDGMFG
ncbi:hypothetical protein BDY21DRAFT_357901 [Lineolata rhizophorae]|uniref:RING-type domain-containing protein n=1 Tax=Lineolata rhizophorae TaxID=578093 RepID=A0A6A6NMF3_9PEZI|nr:hypothetical protein BDY21DRAFT_357901 [Lineolata rhizophorae]